MNTQADVQGFLAEKTWAMAGISRNAQAFSSSVFKDLTSKGFRILAVNPGADSIGSVPCYPSLSALPEKVGGVLLFTPPSETEKVVREAAALGIRKLWIQQGAESEAALRFCRENGLAAVSGQCILMFAPPLGFHGLHRWFWKLFGKIPA
jgi:predicted CoA-binding protein